MENKKKISVVIPVYFNQDNLIPLDEVLSLPIYNGMTEEE